VRAVRLATFNVLHGRAPADGRVDLDRFADAVRTLDADVLALQEVDRAQPRSGSADLTAVAAEAGGYASARFVPALHGEPGSWRAATDDGPAGGAPAYGVALLSRLPVVAERTVRLPALRVPVPVVFSGSRRVQVVRDEPRVAAVTRLETGRGELTVVSTHLSFIAGWNLLQLRRLVRGLAREPRLVVAGDFNLATDQVVRVSRLRPLAAGATFPAHEPVRQIDHLLGRGALTARGARTWDLPLSDHRALSVELDVG
jgi:endonuclease/exonuclease/phosphatase family metal-dependent hydrolase